MVTVVKKNEGQVHYSREYATIRVEILAVTYCTMELGWQKKKEKKMGFDPHWFATLKDLASPSLL